MNTNFGWIKMNIVTRFILMYLPLLVHSNDDGSSTCPGHSPCVYYGDIDTLCNIPTLDVDQIPDECSSILFYEARPTNYTVALTLDSQNENLKALLDCGKKVFLYYSRPQVPNGWLEALDCNLEDGGASARCEMEGLKVFFEEYQGIAGLILYSLDPGVFPANYSCPTEKLKVYLEVMRDTFKDLKIGIDFTAKHLIDCYQKTADYWLDFGVLDSLLDFYIINNFESRTCTPDLKQTGGYPLTGNYSHTVEKAMEIAKLAKLPKEKCLIQYTIVSTSPDPTADPCLLNNIMLCSDPSKFCDVCSDSPCSLFEKGKFAAEHANGFVVDTIDADDPTGICCCPGGPFPALRALLDGFNGADKTFSCPKYELFGP